MVYFQKEKNEFKCKLPSEWSLSRQLLLIYPTLDDVSINVIKLNTPAYFFNIAFELFIKNDTFEYNHRHWLVIVSLSFILYQKWNKKKSNPGVCFVSPTALIYIFL